LFLTASLSSTAGAAWSTCQPSECALCALSCCRCCVPHVVLGVKNVVALEGTCTLVKQINTPAVCAAQWSSIICCVMCRETCWLAAAAGPQRQHFGTGAVALPDKDYSNTSSKQTVFQLDAAHGC
jgi:hypothetical protein